MRLREWEVISHDGVGSAGSPIIGTTVMRSPGQRKSEQTTVEVIVPVSSKKSSRRDMAVINKQLRSDTLATIKALHKLLRPTKQALAVKSDTTKKSADSSDAGSVEAKRLKT